MNLTLFQRVGGEAAVEAAVNRFYEKFLKEEDIKEYFDGVSMEAQIHKIRLFFNQVLGGPCDYTGKDLRVAHAHLVANGMNDYHFDLFIKLMVETLEDLNIPAELIEEFSELMESFRDDVLNKPMKKQNLS